MCLSLGPGEGLAGVLAQQGGGAGVSLPLVAMATSPHGPASDEEATALAQHWLRELLGELRQLAAEADRELGHPDPLRTIGEVLTSRSFDELIVSTLPQRVSRWLGMDPPTGSPPLRAAGDHLDLQRVRHRRGTLGSTSRCRRASWARPAAGTPPRRKTDAPAHFSPYLRPASEVARQAELWDGGVAA